MTLLANDGVTGSSERLHALDAARAFALLLGVFFHSATSLLPGAGQFWPIIDAENSTALGAFFFTSHIFRMAIFFLIAGYFARRILVQRGVSSFVCDRLKRIGTPLIAFGVLNFFFFLIVTAWGSSKGVGRMISAEAISIHYIPFFHLWFLWNLLILYAVALAIWHVLPFFRGVGKLEGFLAELIGRRYGSFVLACPLLLTILLVPRWSAWFGIPTPFAVYSNPITLVAYGAAFAAGWIAWGDPKLLNGLGRHCVSNLVIGLCCATACIWALGPVPTPNPSAWPLEDKLLYAAFYSIAVYALSFSAVGACLRFVARPSRSIRYLADSSYWIYLVHLPVVMALQVMLADSQLPAVLKFLAISIVTFSICIFGFEVVRSTFIGRWLNGVPQLRPRERY